MFKNLFLFGIICVFVQLVIAQSFQEDCVNAHNKYRKIHKSPNLVFDSQVAQVAQDWADHLAKTGQFEHRPNNKYGENLYAMFGSSSASCAMAVKSWYDEIKDYNYNKAGFAMDTGHFTQVVWKNSKKLGCAIARKRTSTYIVCNYDPPGNFLGQFPQNVLRK